MDTARFSPRAAGKIQAMTQGVLGGLGGKSNGRPRNFQHHQLVTVVLIGKETGGGYYQGSILFGGSNGGGDASHAPGSLTFQLQEQTVQRQTDGPQPQTNPNGTLKNNALVVNLAEPAVTGSHMLFADTAERVAAVGRVMGVTNESPPRQIVYIDKWPLMPCVAHVTGTYQASTGGVYFGRLVQGAFASGTNFGYTDLLSSLSSSFLPAADNCWITNNWEQTYGTLGHNALSAGQYIWGITAGFPQFSSITPTNTDSNNIWYQVYTWFPPQAAALIHTITALTTTQTAGGGYGTNEQTMLNNLKADSAMLQEALSNLYVNLRVAGYQL